MEPFVCPRCGRKSYNPDDKKEGYCGDCHDWTGKPQKEMDMEYISDYERELAALKREAGDLRKLIKSSQVERWTEQMSSRKLPPMSGLTRTQKRYFLEPWMTTLAVSFIALATVFYIVGIIMWNRIAWIGVVFSVLAAIAFGLKVNFMDINEKSEGELLR